MKKLKIIPVVLLLVMASCTDLTETLHDKVDARKFYNNEEEIEAGLTNAYYELLETQIWMHQFVMQEVTTEIGIVATHTGGGWNNGGQFDDMHFHQWDATHTDVVELYSKLYNVIASTNSLVELLQEKGDQVDDAAAALGEMKALRAYAYSQLLDLYGNVPIVTKAQIDPNNLPSNMNTTRADVFEFVKEELQNVISNDNIPSVADMSAGERQNYYPRFTKEIAQAVLVRLHLNAEVYSGQAEWQAAAEVANDIINSGAFALTENVGDSFVPENENSEEIILAVSQNNSGITQGPFSAVGGNWINQLGLHPDLQSKYNLPISPWGGTSVSVDHFNDYEADDDRRNFILHGEQTDDAGNVLVDLQPIENIDNSPFSRGYKSIKYAPDPQMNGVSARNDQVLIRYAEILLSRAEALWRMNPGDPEAVSLVNQVRERNFDNYTPLTTLDREMLLKEWGREFMWETHHRTHLIRFDEFLTNDYQFRTEDSAPFRKVFPIPEPELDRNPNLKQNPGY
ncbi:MAG: RagB/SusD family nutrient uptake outer membrane protein [Bacteroidetes bacterium]|nr:RagB/SusD family nutrient uptake outer membrane protein [Bacteroidota bacterium]